MNLPNAISLGRLIVLTPLFVLVLLVGENPFGALVVLVVLGVTDWADGFIARRFDQVTDFGKKLDPVADRVSQFVVCVTLVLAGLVPVWMAVVLFLSDLLLGIVVMVRQPGIVRVRWIGRLRTVLLMVGFPLILLVASFAPQNGVLTLAALVVVGAGVVLHALANLQYVAVLARTPRGAQEV
ncbi:CDP-alcohol phosphatidyltransferase family protein [Herbiconiux sp. KACC 21604]|uniref:CDP-alcohol phosphatidyltransferase family protein n=1 Tax=unclassified Herbiconiux TaxID=2618217 RepID=UPI0014925FF1|nr:CDP-alcohol phosphatidyltransferase family protein [Herbiconiux sp. SALV-R1]QJU53147.1 CDP-alcohol phosphatidyltransferase family protein [Herbiconiux sp. SALV-R1]WPO88090.1 CDP-alcohol phosphatidyltransferase family protein [Herbiconiux sp. KACC 21604]